MANYPRRSLNCGDALSKAVPGDTIDLAHGDIRADPSLIRQLTLRVAKRETVLCSARCPVIYGYVTSVVRR